MVGLGNSRRGIKSPPLLVAALVACIIVLGFNYWIASSRSVDLQVLLFCWFFTMSESMYTLFYNVGFYLKITMHFRIIISDKHLEHLANKQIRKHMANKQIRKKKSTW